jgi:uncharacterized membrane protein YfcA
LLDNEEAVAIPVYQQPGSSNAIDISNKVRAKMEELKKDFPEGVDYRIVYDPTVFVRESISAVVQTLVEALVLVVLVVVGSYVVLTPSLGERTELRFSGHRHTAAAMATGLAIGFYDGALGPGTGSFFVFTLVGLLGYSFLEGSAKARLANWATNLAALCIFVPQGAVLWKVGLIMGGANLLGGYVGARTAVRRGSRFVRVFFIVVVSAFVVRIGGELLGWWG